VDPTRPNYLAAQVIMGRWILGDRDIACPPQSEIPVSAMVVMAGMYNITSGLKELPYAIEEAQSLAASYASLPAVPLDFTSANFKTLLDAKLVHNFKAIGIEAVHLAGHGEVNPQRPGDAALFTNDGKPLSPRLFLTAQLGKKHRPFMFLNACMVGVGGELLGSYEGFPGCCLIGGFTALLAPLWAVNDDVAKSFALEFYDNALVKGGGRPVAEVLRDLRAKYDSNNPVVSYLAYVYYGSPHLRLRYQGN
jgi:CHAT domain-containing protein